MNLLYQDDYFIAIHKPSGFHVHPHEDSPYRVPRSKICLYEARRIMKQHVFPVHRLDAGTSGVLLFALSSEIARLLCKQFAERIPKKTYHAVVRGYPMTEGLIDIDLELDSTDEKAVAVTSYKSLRRLELPFAVGNRFPTTRYTLIEAEPHTGRFHQIRRHFNRISHPLLGDSEHGDTRHNRLFRENLGISGLCLKASQLSFPHPVHGAPIAIQALTCDKWNKIHSLFAEKGTDPL